MKVYLFSMFFICVNLLSFCLQQFNCYVRCLLIIILVINQMAKEVGVQKFSFQYYLDLGNNKISHIFISQQSDPYVQASKLCAKESLPSILVTILGDSIKQQMNHERNLVLLHQKRTNTSTNKSLTEADLKPNQEIQTLNTEIKDQLTRDPSFQCQRKSKAIDRNTVFENLYNNYKEIQRKKQLSRKKSYESIPFRPQINPLSDKIVSNKRRIEEEKTSFQQTGPLKARSNNKFMMTHSNTKISYTVSQANNSRENSKDQLYQRSSIYLKKSQDKRKKLKESIQKKLMENCSFRPKINNKLR